MQLVPVFKISGWYIASKLKYPSQQSFLDTGQITNGKSNFLLSAHNLSYVALQ